MRYESYISEQTDPYRNLAMERCLLDFVDEDVVILFLWQNADTIVIGRNQDPYLECRAEEFLSQGGKIARRMSGGGAVYHDLGNLNFSILSKTSEMGKAAYQELVLDVARRLGVDATYSGRNDIMCAGGKFSGNATYRNGDKVCQHGTLLVCTDIGKMARYLTPEREKLDRHAVGSVRSRVQNLSEMDPRITVESVRECFLETTHAETLAVSLGEDAIDKYARAFGSKEWIFGGKYEDTVSFGLCS